MLTPDALAAALAIRDLTDPAQGRHAVQLIADDILAAVVRRWPELGPPTIHRGERIVDVADNYDRLGYSAAAAARDARYTRYVDDRRMLRSQTSALIPGALRGLARSRAMVACPGVVYRRDAIDRLHTGTPHQLDLWLLGAEPAALTGLVGVAVGAALPGVRWRTRPAVHPYTTGGLEIEALAGDSWVEIGECGVAAAHVVGPGRRGLALGVGLDRLVMVRKGIDDIRLLRSDDPRVAGQMTDLAGYRPVSRQPAAYRDLSLILPCGVSEEDLGDRVREVLGADEHLVEAVQIVAVTGPEALPRLRDGEVNVLLRITLRDLRGTLPKRAANELRDRIHLGLTGRALLAG
ncbi:PheS-related mystery ligase SrmL [Paractinoplanes rishiriensis]|uniref:FDX-ACB domain-containing protein n=1 Tax=Paractinoplanes rishiriensis TaxID=1050105 RepID=A0A919JYG5_9ACTN|nr:hypothetical protein [Actinoplanes rishiriensis]GIE97215.1 hypothetical protein Ari01nite_46800 [Actinoplanes rishiriensis]